MFSIFDFSEMYAKICIVDSVKKNFYNSQMPIINLKMLEEEIITFTP